MTVSIIICTRNRAESLRQTLESVGHAAVPNGWNVELLVIDNGSTDRTRDVVERALIPLMSIRCVSEPKAGLSHARNRGIREALGEVLLWLDDDIRVPAKWLELMCRPILDNTADAGAGGVTFPESVRIHLAQLPDARLAGWFASTHSLDRSVPGRMVGANMVFHRRVLSKVPGFETELGAGPNALGFGEETLFSWQLTEAGFRIAPLFDVEVEHHFDLSRMTKDGLLASARRLGHSDAYLDYHWRHQEPNGVRAKLALYVLWRAWIGMRDRLFGCGPYLISFAAISAEHKIAFYRETLKQGLRPRRYKKRGLESL
jgi:glycosyltransferase involved in cell wall biosynthesis